VLVIYAATNGYLDPYPPAAARRYEAELYRFFDTRHPDLLKEIADKKDVKPAADRLKAALDEFATVFQAEPAEKPAA
jgi:F-type H+-transporting ATPase subunit alpha